MLGQEHAEAGGDRAVLMAAAAGRADAVRTLIDRAGPVVYGFVFARVGGDAEAAEDLLQETFAEAVASAATYRGDAALETWMCAIARRRVARYYEQERRRAIARAALVVVDDEVPEPAERASERDQVLRALGALPPLHRQVLVWKYLDELSVEEIATELARPRVQVQSLLQRARAGLRRQLEAADG